MGGGSYLVLDNYQALQLKYRSLSPLLNHFSLLNIDDMDYSL